MLCFQESSEEHTAKLNYANRYLEIGDVTSFCNLLGLDYKGTKDELVYRICSGLMDVNSLQAVPNEEEEERSDDENEAEGSSDEDEGDDDGDGDSGAGSHMSVSSNNNRTSGRKALQFAIHYKDVEDSIRSFDGSDNHYIEKWIADFEDMATLYGWDSLQKLIFTRKSLTGVAKLFIQSEKNLTTWKKLKSALQDEFGLKINSAKLHEMLGKRKIKKTESVQEYFLVMKEIAGRGEIKTDALIHYVIDGIVDDTRNKLCLFGARTLKDFKEKLRVYNEINKMDQDRDNK